MIVPFLGAQQPAAVRDSPPSTSPKVLIAGPPRVREIEVYGQDKLNAAEITRQLGVRVGEALSDSRRELEERLERVPGVTQAHVEGYCCLDNDVVLYVGVVESGAKPFSLHSPPTEDLALPTKLDLVYQRLLRAIEQAHERGLTGESYDRGYPISEDDDARRAQETLALVVDPYVEDLGEILRRSADEQVRAAAAYILAYTKDKAVAEGFLQYALRDFDPGVRLNALRSLEFVRRALAAMPPGDDGNRKTVSPTWLIEMLNSVEFQDRLEASRMLVRILGPENSSAYAQLEERALPALVQMAQWKVAEHAMAPYTLLGRMAGVPDSEIQRSLLENRRDTVLGPTRERAKEKKRFLLF